MANGIDDRDHGNFASRPKDPVDVPQIGIPPDFDVADDLPAFLSRASLSGSQYREFSSPARLSQPVSIEPPAEVREPDASASQSGSANRQDAPEIIHLRHVVGSEEHQLRKSTRETASVARVVDVSETKTPAKNHSNDNGNVARLGAQAEAIRNNHKRSESAVESRWSVLGRALPADMDDSPGRLIRSLANAVSLPFSFICSVGGGTGVTTIAATLARCLAAEGERVLLADSNVASLFPLYFGAANPGTEELHSFSIIGSDGCVDTVNRSECERLAPKAPRTHEQTEPRNLVVTIRNAAVNSQRLLVDPGSLDADDVETLQSPKQFGLVPLVPDLSCVFGLLRLEQALREQETKSHQSSKIFYVLNKFDGALALHRDIKASLEKLLGERLLPITLRRSDAVAEALADGMTVIEYRPESGVAQDFFRLAAWLREFAPTSRRGRSN